MRMRILSWSAGLLWVGWMGAHAAPPAPKPDSGASVDVGEAPLSDLARKVLHRRMGRHGGDVAELTTAVVLLRYEVAADAAPRIANEPRLVRPVVGGEDDLNAAIPERFFVLQDQLRDKAQRLAIQARQQSPAEMADGFGQLTGTCVSCHASFGPARK